MTKKIAYAWFFVLIIIHGFNALNGSETSKDFSKTMFFLYLLLFPIIINISFRKCVNNLFLWLMFATIAPYLALPVLLFINKNNFNSEPSLFSFKYTETKNEQNDSNYTGSETLSDKISIFLLAVVRLTLKMLTFIFSIGSTNENQSNTRAPKTNASQVISKHNYSSIFKNCATCEYFASEHRKISKYTHESEIENYNGNMAKGKCVNRIFKNSTRQSDMTGCPEWRLWALMEK